MSDTYTVSKDVDVSVAIECEKRSHGALTFRGEVSRGGTIQIDVEPCADCLEEAREEGRGETTS